jgi:hypothetical protein
MRHKIFLFMFMMASATVFLSTVSHTESEEAPLPHEEEITGQVVYVNYDTSMIHLNSYSDTRMTKPREDSIYVLAEAEIEKNGTKLTFKDLSFGQYLTVKYVIADDGRKEAVHIWVKD